MTVGGRADQMAARIMPGFGRGASADDWHERGRDLRLSLPIDGASAARVRRALREYLVGEGVACDIAEDVVLATDEACINAILHSRTAGKLRVRAGMVDGCVRVEVRDPGRGFAVGRVDTTSPVDPLAPHGRGLFLIGRLMDDVRIESHPGVGTVVQMLKRLRT
jgi:serine/threonine-protein kinase RsbW